MSKPATAATKPEITLEQGVVQPLYKQLYERLRAQILAGQLETGARLPSTRALSSQLGVSRGTTALVYEMLGLEGYVTGRVGDGTRVARVQPMQVPRVDEGADDLTAVGTLHTSDIAAQPREWTAPHGLLANNLDPGDSYPAQRGTVASVFRVGQPDVTYFPYATWARLVARHARHPLRGVSLYQDGKGYAPLRDAVAAHIGISRGVHCSPDQVIITAGSQGALDLASRVLLNRGDPAWVEDPGYLGARGALLAAGACLVPVPVDSEGIDVEAGRRLSGTVRDARLAVVTPSHQFPTAVAMSLGRRLALLEWSREVGAWIVEDDYDSEYRFSGRPLEALHGLDSTERVIYVGTFSKVLFPSLRLGYLVAPHRLLPALIAARRYIDVHPPLLEQMALADFITESHYIRYLRKMRLLYLERRNALVNALRQEMSDLVEVAAPEAGMHLVAWIRPGTDVHTLARQAAAQGVHVLPVSNTSSPRGYGLVLGFASATPDELRVGVQTLASTLRS